MCWIYSYRLPGGSAVECFLLFEQQHCANLGKGRGAAPQQIGTINDIFFSRSNVIARTEDTGARERTSCKSPSIFSKHTQITQSLGK